MWKKLWQILANESGQEPSSDVPASEETASETADTSSDDSNVGVRLPYDESTPNEAHSVGSETQQTQDASQTQTQEEPYLAELNLDPKTWTPEMQEVFKRVQAAHTKKMQKFKSYEGHLQNMEKFYNDKDFAEQTLRQWAQKNGLSLVPQQFNNQQATPKQEGTNALQAKLVETLKSKLPPETQWMADGQASAIFSVMQEVLGPVLQEFQGFKTAKEENEWKALETSYQDAEEKFAAANPGWEAHEDDMAEMLNFFNDKRAFTHPKFGSKHQLLHKLVTGNANAVKEATQRITNAGKNRTPVSAPKRAAGGGFKSVQDEVASTSDRNEAFGKAAASALQQLRRRH